MPPCLSRSFFLLRTPLFHFTGKPGGSSGVPGSLIQPVLLRKTPINFLCPPNLSNVRNVQTSRALLCPHPQDQGAFLCVVDDSNEHMLSVWDCSRGAKLAEIKVRSPGDLMGF